MPSAALPSNGDALTYEVVTPNYEGVRIAFYGMVNGWFLLRKSLHDPIMPLNIETNQEGGADIIRADLKSLLSKIEGLDTSKL
jgi:phosphomannomutase